MSDCMLSLYQLNPRNRQSVKIKKHKMQHAVYNLEDITVSHDSNMRELNIQTVSTNHISHFNLLQILILFRFYFFHILIFCLFRVIN